MGSPRKGKRPTTPEPAIERWNPSPRVRAFLSAYKRTCSITRAAEAAGITRSAHYRLLERNPLYKVAFDAASAIAADSLEDEAIRRAVEGERKPLIYHGDLVRVPRRPGDPDCKELVTLTEVERSDSLLLALLKAKKPREYGDKIEHGVSPDLAEKFDGTFEELLLLYRGLTTKGEHEE